MTPSRPGSQDRQVTCSRVQRPWPPRPARGSHAGEERLFCVAKEAGLTLSVALRPPLPPSDAPVLPAGALGFALAAPGPPQPRRSAHPRSSPSPQRGRSRRTARRPRGHDAPSRAVGSQGPGGRYGPHVPHGRRAGPPLPPAAARAPGKPPAPGMRSQTVSGRGPGPPLRAKRPGSSGARTSATKPRLFASKNRFEQEQSTATQAESAERAHAPASRETGGRSGRRHPQVREQWLFIG